MALIIEDGSIVANANSYVTVAETRTFATDRNYTTLPVADSDVEALLIVAKDYLEAQRDKYQGSKTEPATQALQWPRINVKVDGYPVDGNAIPVDLKNAQMQLVLEQNDGVDIQPSIDENFITFEKVGPIETKYSEKVGTSSQPTMTAVNSWLEPLYKSTASGGLTTLRI